MWCALGFCMGAFPNVPIGRWVTLLFLSADHQCGIALCCACVVMCVGLGLVDWSQLLLNWVDLQPGRVFLMWAGCAEAHGTCSQARHAEHNDTRKSQECLQRHVICLLGQVATQRSLFRHTNENTQANSDHTLTDPALIHST